MFLFLYSRWIPLLIIVGNGRLMVLFQNTSDATHMWLKSWVRLGYLINHVKNIQSKAFVWEMTNGISRLSPVNFKLSVWEHIFSTFPRPYILKPVTGASKKGVNFVDDSIKELFIPEDLKAATFMAETFVNGKEYSVEAMSYHGQHQVI